MAKNLVNGTNIVIEESGDNISMDLSSSYNTNLQQKINGSFKENNTYSTEEQVIGTWIDGKPIYRKVIISSGITGNSAQIPHGISNIKKVTEWDANANHNNTNWLHNNNQHYIQLNKVDNTNIYATIGDGLSSEWDISIILEYTKTTD